MSLEIRAQRANYPLFTPVPIVPSPGGHSWKVDDDGSFNFDWTGDKIVPQELTARRWMIIKILQQKQTFYMSVTMYLDEE